MNEVFKPRENMFYRHDKAAWLCQDENFHLVCDGGPSRIWNKGRDWQFIVGGIGFHRLDGPATSEGRWYINNKHVTYEIHQFAKENGIDLKNLQDEDKVVIALKFG